jgi:hypothetical protein
VSACISRFIPDTWCIGWTGESRVEEAQAFDINRKTLSKVIDRVTPRFGSQLGWPNIVFNLETARQLVEQFVSTTNDFKKLELGLHKSFIEIFCNEAEPPPQQSGFAPIGHQGIHEAIF